MEWTELSLYVGLGFFIGILSGFFGIGGGIILTPLLLVIGYEPSAAIIMSLLLTLGSTTSGALSHIRLKNVNKKSALTIGLFGALGSLVATPLVLYLETISGAQIVISLSYITLLVYFAISFFRKQTGTKDGAGKTTTTRLGLIGVFGGFISSLMGVSGGFVLTPLQVRLLNEDMKRAVGTSITAAVIIVVTGVVNYSAAGTEVNYLLGIALIIGALFGSPLGASQLQGFTSRTVKLTLGAFYLVVATSVFFNLIELNALSMILLFGSSGGFIAYLFVRRLMLAVR